MDGLHDMHKKDLARAYWPELSPSSAQRKLVRWIHRNPRLMARLKEKKYQERKKILTANQLKIIYFYLGKP